MRKKSLILIISLLILTACENQEELTKSKYIAVKSNLLTKESYTKNEDLPLDITISLDREQEEVVTYEVLLSNPKEDMHDIKAMVVHNYNNEDTFPSIGVFDDSKELLTTIENTNSIKLNGEIKTSKNISKLNLQLKVWIEYTNNAGEKKDIYYKTT